ncbi:MAG: PilZ domain-containing protein [Spirochaetia bacterium]|nr:PilZ domain-containing protein [Spirochaetia bacterium]
MSEAQKGWLEQRSSERLSDVLKVVYYPVDGNAAQAVSSEDYKDTTIEKIQEDRSRHSYIQAMTDDVSKGGMSIMTSTPMSIGQMLVIDLFLPKLNKPVKLLAEVRNVERNIKGANTFKAGLKIVSMSKSDLKRVENHIMELKFK